ncbi:MAG: hypothetical protein L6Q35_03940 [Phycisphaerales bacterium]|nr:hypothetical protein [Phycisphaerales bacterium]
MNVHYVRARVRSRGVLGAAALVAACGLAQAQPAAWNSASTGFWNTASNWNPAVVPDGASFLVTIDATGSLYDVFLDINPTVGSLTIDSGDATLQLQGNGIAVTGSFTLNNGLLRGPGTSGGLIVGGTATFSGISSDRDVLSCGTLTFNGDVDFLLSDDVDICDTDVNYNGSSCSWQGTGELGGGLGSVYTFSSNTTFTVMNDERFRHNGIGAAPSVINNGTIVKTMGSGITEFFDVSLANAGTLEVQIGTIKSNGVSTPGNTLTGGTWNVLNGSTLELVGNTITTNAATVHLSGAGATFAAINGLATNSSGATFRLSSGRDFTTAGGFVNNGTLNVGASTQFTSTGSFTQGSSTVTGGGVVKSMGNATFSGPTTAPVIDGGTTFESNADLSISGASGLRLDTGGVLSHKGATGSWTGGAISMGDGSSLSIETGGLLEATNNQDVTWDNTGTRPTLNVAGTFTKKTGTGLTFVSGVSLQNTGTIRVESGTLRSDQPPVTGGTLGAGTWVVQGASALDFVATAVTTNAADVTLDGTAASFAALENNLSTNATSGILTLAGGKDMTTAGNLTNAGRIVLNPGSIFEVPAASSYTNFNAGTQTLTGGEIIITSTSSDPGVFRWTDPAFKIKTLAAKISLSGAGSLIDNGTRVNESALNELETVTEVGTFEINQAREFRPEGNFAVLEAGPDRGRLVIGDASLFEIQDGFTLVNYNAGAGEINEGDFDVRGTLSFPGAEIRRVNSTIAMAGTGSIINKTTGIEAFGALEYITTRGDFTVRAGKDLDVFPNPLVGPPETLQVDGRLAVGEGAPGDDSVMTVHGDFQQNPGSLVEVLVGGVLNVLGAGSGSGGGYTSDTGSVLRLGGGIVSAQEAVTIGGELSGNGQINGQLFLTGRMSPGDTVGFLGVMGSVNLQPLSVLTIDLQNYGAGVGFDQLAAAGPIVITPAARLEIQAAAQPGFEFAFGQLFRVMNASNIIGMFDPTNVSGTDLGNGLYLKLDWDDPTALRLVVVPAPASSVLIAGSLLVARRRRR